MRAFARLITKIIFKILFKVEVINLSKVPVEGSALVCANHNTILDMFFLGYKLKRWIHWMAKEELFRNPIAAYVLRKLGAFSIKRGRGDVSSIKNAYKLLEDGKLVGIFPHGTRIVSTNIEKAKVKPGAVMIAVNAGVPIIPATVSGSYKLFSKMRIIFGDPFYIEKKEEKFTKEEISDLSKDIIRKIYSLSEAYM
jgi:1-acyl-sn-glycerol-3-phosphate acyltransferase